MREIKFRAWSIEKQAWVYFGIDNVPTWVHPAEIYQYTGLKDKSGREIYEGDIVDVVEMPNSPYERHFVGGIVYKDGSFWIKKQGKTEVPLHGITYEPYNNGYRPLICSVIGNIYENLELVES